MSKSKEETEYAANLAKTLRRAKEHADKKAATLEAELERRAQEHMRTDES